MYNSDLHQIVCQHFERNTVPTQTFGKSPVVIISMLAGSLIGSLAGTAQEEQASLTLVGLVAGLAIGTLLFSRNKA